MYFLKRKPEPPAYLNDPESEAASAIKMATQLLADSAAGLRFDADRHEYFLGGRRIPCVSDIVEWYAPFDSVGVAEKCSKNPKHEHYNKSINEILAIWEQNRDRAAEAGTQIHEFGEACFLYMSYRDEEIAPEYRDRIKPEGFAAVIPKEEAVARWWDELDTDRFILIAKETRVVNPVLHYAGTFDLLLYDLEEHCFVLKDYKTNEELFKSYGSKLRPPLSLIKADSHGKYTLQQNLYRIQLENIGIKVGMMDLIWLKESGQPENVTIPNYEPLVRYAMANRENNL